MFCVEMLVNYSCYRFHFMLRRINALFNAAIIFRVFGVLPFADNAL